MSIAELARGAGVGVETVRYYQRRGLLPDPRPQQSGTRGIRHYGPDDTRRLRFIRAAKAAGFTLEEVAELLALDRSEDRARAREMARARIALLDARIGELQQARQALSRLAKECAAGDAGPCPIIAAFESAPA
ncbi:MAG: MerR family transcriptional regulator [Sphingomonadales bacterium 32-68-7]|nr:MAG: MerR family transcriptional regulator [Sphingomonadales bacterium 12-68-11]OYX09295.1 MAG: MerR family transcriptional regulator [Sphingomonadales bacterium 32-68-7]